MKHLGAWGVFHNAKDEMIPSASEGTTPVREVLIPGVSKAPSPRAVTPQARVQRVRSLLRAAAMLIDLLLVNVAFLIAYWLRYELGIGGEVLEQHFVELRFYFPLQIILSLLTLAVYALSGLYRRPGAGPILDEASTLLGSTSIGMMLLFSLIFLLRSLAYSRGLLLMLWVLILLLLFLGRVVLRLMMAYLRRQGVAVRRALVVGDGALGKNLMHALTTEPGLGYQLVGFLGGNGDGDLGRFRRLGGIEELARVAHEQNIHEVMVALPSSGHSRTLEILDCCRREGLSFKIVPDLLEMSLGRVDIDQLRGIPLIGVKEVSIQGLNRFLKRTLDTVLASALLLLWAPLWGLIALLIKLDSPGPVYFRQVRQGKGGKPFVARKFRSMREGAEEEQTQLIANNEASGPLFKIRQDPRVTRVGHLLRRTSFDEVPQLLNVLLGEMSLVGPRPPLPSEVAQYEAWHHKRLEVAPGMTGLWQVSGRSDLPFDEMVMLDIYYIENWSLGLDFQILLRTIPAVLSGRGAY